MFNVCRNGVQNYDFIHKIVPLITLFHERVYVHVRNIREQSIYTFVQMCPKFFMEKLS